MALDRRERLVCLRALRLAEEYYKLLIRQPIMDRPKTQNCSGVITALKRAIQNDRTTLFAPAKRCAACERLEGAEGVDSSEGQ